MKGFIKSIQAYFKAFALLSKLKLWKYFAIPMLVSLATAIVIVLISYSISDNLGFYISKLWTLDSGKETFTFISTFFSGFILLVFGFFTFKYIVLAVSAPFMGPISKKIENHLVGENLSTLESTSWELLSRGVKISIRNISRELLLTMPILLLTFIPIIGFFTSVILLLMQSYFVGFGNMDYTLERHFNYKNSIAFVKNNRGIAIGNGIVFVLFLFLPVIGVILVLPLSVTAATIVTVNQLEKQEVK